jgi:hypothetical protein
VSVCCRKNLLKKQRERARRDEEKHRQEHGVSRSYTRMVKKRYGLSWEEYKERISRAKGLCELCGKPFNKPHLDHCHDSKRIRGVLCHQCNVGIGMFMDDPDILAKAVAYLKTERDNVDVVS